MYAPAVTRVRDFISRQLDSKVPCRETGQVRPYDSSVAQIGFRIIENPEEFASLDKRFKSVLDFDGVPMHEIARRYWEDPEFAEELRQKIAEDKSRRKR